MILKFKAFEKLGYNEDVSKLAEYAWKKYKSGEKYIDMREYSIENLPFFIKNLFIDEYNDKNDGVSMSASFSESLYRDSKSVGIKINTAHKPILSDFEHEMKHIYDFLIVGGKFSKVKDYKLSPFLRMSSSDDNLHIFLYIIYLLDISEITAFYHSDIRNYKDNKTKFRNFKYFLKSSRLNSNLKFLNQYNIGYVIENITKEDKLVIISYYYEYLDDRKYKEKVKDFNMIRSLYEEYKKDILNRFKKKPTYSDEQIDRFFNNIKKEVEIKKKVYRKYIERLWSYFN